MRILVFEFFTGGGFVNKSWSPSLANEGSMMLQALLTELKCLSNIQLVILLDWRFHALVLPAQAEIVVVEPGQDFFQIMEQQLAGCDACWPIAPELDSILLTIAESGQRCGKTMFLSTIDAIRCCSDKLKTVQQLKKQGIDAIDTQKLSDLNRFHDQKSVIKPIDGAGCEQSYIISSEHNYRQIVNILDSPDKFISQPYLEGRSLSISALFKNGQAWMLCINEQQVETDNGSFNLQSCRVNVPVLSKVCYQQLLQQIALAIPGLWGYIGIDLIESKNNRATVLEINPRLTTSYGGIFSATGINVAEQVLKLVDTQPVIALNNQRFNVVITT